MAFAQGGTVVGMHDQPLPAFNYADDRVAGDGAAAGCELYRHAFRALNGDDRVGNGFTGQGFAVSTLNRNVRFPAK